MGDISDQIVTNAKATINKKLFDDGKAGTIECNIKRASRRKIRSKQYFGNIKRVIWQPQRIGFCIGFSIFRND